MPDVRFKAEIEEIRKAIEQKGAKWKAGETSISRLPPSKRMELLSPVRYRPVVPSRPPFVIPSILPTSYDWTNVNGINYITPVRAQYGGTCSPFASTAALESCVARAGLLEVDEIDLSEHAITSFPDVGGGNLHLIAAYLQETGLPPEDWFPDDLSTARDGWQRRTYKVVSWDCFFPTSVEEIKTLIIHHGPSVTTMKCPEDFFHYLGGVYSNIGQPGHDGHSVLVVGYDDRDRCFKCKNSWGVGWGEDRFGTSTLNDNGFFRIAYSEFGDPVTDFGWDIHTYSGAIGPPVDVSRFIGVHRN